VKRENIIPYIMGANISTFVDTLLVAVLVGVPHALTIVLALVLGVALFSLAALAGFYRSYRDGIEWCLDWITKSRYTFIVFMMAITAVPVALMLI
jgi:predicted membrane channel-forming protein YqfA (hemolysin III family)